LVSGNGDVVIAAELVNDEYGEVESVVIETELRLDAYEPADELLPHPGSNLGVSGHKIIKDVGLFLEIAFIPVYLLDVRRYFRKIPNPLAATKTLCLFDFGFFVVFKLDVHHVRDIDAKEPG